MHLKFWWELASFQQLLNILLDLLWGGDKMRLRTINTVPHLDVYHLLMITFEKNHPVDFSGTIQMEESENLYKLYGYGLWIREVSPPPK